MEHLTCPNDIASKIEMEFTQDSEKAIRALVPEEKPELAEDDEVECEDCSEVLDIRRARLGYSKCPRCSEWAAKTNKHRRYSNYNWED